MTSGQKKARPSRNTSIPITPTLNFSTDPWSDGERKMTVGDKRKQKIAKAVAQDLRARDLGRQAACLALSSGLTWMASQAGCSAANPATAMPLTSASPTSLRVKLPAAKSTTVKRSATVCPTATSAACANNQPNKLPAKEPITARINASARINRNNSPRRIPKQRSVPISLLLWTTETDTVL